jgi:DNA-binding XRE family transcriptional regulator
MPNICKCGCLRPCAGEYIPRHIHGHTTRSHPVDYIIEDRGYKTPCWVWQLGTRDIGYGRIKTDGINVGAHVYYYRYYIGPVPEGLELDHLCRVPGCVNPEHLEPVTQVENVRRSSLAKLSKEVVQEIGIRYQRGESQRQIAKSLDVSQTHIGSILRGEHWIGIVTSVPTRRDCNLFHSKLTSKHVRQSRSRAASGESRKSLASTFNVSENYIGRVVRGISRATVEA